MYQSGTSTLSSIPHIPWKIKTDVYESKKKFSDKFKFRILTKFAVGTASTLILFAEKHWIKLAVLQRIRKSNTQWRYNNDYY